MLVKMTVIILWEKLKLMSLINQGKCYGLDPESLPKAKGFVPSSAIFLSGAFKKQLLTQASGKSQTLE